MSSYVSIVVKGKLSKENFALWFNTVQDHVPSGLIAETQLTPDKYSKYYVKKTKRGGHKYVVPLKRDLDASEVHALLKAWCEAYPEGDFIFDHSQPVEHAQAAGLDLTQQKIAAAQDAWSKLQHQHWLTEKQNQGWRYGVTINLSQKTHPWIQPWESLPQAAKDRNLQAAKDLLMILNDHGWTLTQKLDA
jgi:hypothetical protein